MKKQFISFCYFFFSIHLCNVITEKRSNQEKEILSFWVVKIQERILTRAPCHEVTQPVYLRKLMKRLKIFDFQKRNTKFLNCQNPRAGWLCRRPKISCWTRVKHRNWKCPWGTRKQDTLLSRRGEWFPYVSRC